ncbi:transcriptional regulator [Burkholderia ubonensis]|uniref:transcriptional regulator n=1 Tax=Burkholderia ubonensis TaxID=101571 RepID=UPI0009B4432A|nr:transcriptional regulator [Burkholderia ubonensis]
MKKGSPQTQQEFLRHAMSVLGMTREQFAERIGAKPRALNNWLLPVDSSEYRSMPDMAWKFVREILENRSKRA